MRGPVRVRVQGMNAGRTLLPEDIGRKSASCCCCSTLRVISVCSTITFILGIVFGIIGLFVNEKVHGWEASSFEMLGSLCIALGIFLVFLSLLGLCASRTHARTPLLAYFFLLLLLSAALLLACLYAVVEADKLRSYLRDHWPTIKQHLGIDDLVGGEGVAFEDVLSWASEYLAIIGSVGASAVAVLFVALAAAMRELGVRQIAMTFLAVLGVLGLVEIAISFATRGNVPPATTWLLLGCAAVQMLCAATGICGFRLLNAECLFWSCLVQLVSTAGLAYISAGTYLWLRNAHVSKPENLLLVFAITVVATFFLATTLAFVLILYCMRRRAFLEADRAAELPIEFSDYATRERPQGSSGGRRAPAWPWAHSSRRAGRGTRGRHEFSAAIA